MIPRYSRPEMAALWSEEAKLNHWLEIEVLACEGMARIGVIPADDAQIIRAKAAYDIEKVRENEKRTNHDVIAVLEEVATHVGGPGRYIHRGLTSSDLLDTTLALQCVASSHLLLADLGALRAAVAIRAKEHKFTPMMGRSHGIHAEPITYGLNLALMYDEFGRAEKRLIEARDQIAVGKLSGAVGTHAHLDPRVEEYVCEKLGLMAAVLSTQIIQRDRVPASPAHRGARSGGIFRRRPEGEQRHAAQAQPDHGRKAERPRAGHSRQRCRGAGKRGALARARYFPLVGRADHLSR